MSLRYFGTDGIRGIALHSPLTPEEVTRWGTAWRQVAAAAGVTRLVLGWDPRTSSDALAAAFVQGMGPGFPILSLGMAPTPAVAWTVARLSLEGERTWGLMISASHNPPEDNGLKGFNELGEKLEESQERAIEAAFKAAPLATAAAPAPTHLDLGPYLAHLEGIDLPPDFRVVIDCAHGATAEAARRLFRGADIHWLGCPADGQRINVGVGSTHLDALAAVVAEQHAHLGIAFDGDGDRCLLVDGTGTPVDGDQMLFAYGAANLAAGFTGSLLTGNSPSRSAAMDASGAKSQLPSLVAAMGVIDQRWGHGVRQVVRWSGTEPKLRLMVEAQRQPWVDQALTELEAAARLDLGLT